MTWPTRIVVIACAGVAAACSSSPSAPSVGHGAPSTIVAGNAQTCLLSTAGQAYCWGADSTGLLGIGNAVIAQTIPAPVVDSQTYSALTGAQSFRCALSGGTPWCWGQTLIGDHGGFLFTDSTPTTISSAVQFSSIATGPSHGCGLTSSGAAYCWGENDFGQLGTGDTVSHTSAVAVTGGMSFAAISVGFWHTCALTSSGTAYCWGRNTSGELGFPPMPMVSTPQPVGGGKTFVSISAGTLYTCALASGGQAYCWGLNEAGNLGDSTDTSRTTPTPVVQSGLTFAAVITSAANKVIPTTCAITTSGAAYCWGAAGDGQLGDPSVTTPYSMIPVPVSGGLSFSTLSIGMSHVCGITTSRAAYCWGQNDHGQLGDGTTQATGTPVAVGGNLTADLTRHGWR